MWIVIFNDMGSVHSEIVSVIGWMEKYYEYKFFFFFTYVILIVKQKPRISWLWRIYEYSLFEKYKQLWFHKSFNRCSLPIQHCLKISLHILIQLITYKVYTHSMETIDPSLVHTGSLGTFFMISPVFIYCCNS